MAGRRDRNLKKTKIEIIPMIDTMFFLLVFFILSSVGVIKFRGLSVNLPKPSAPTQVQQNTPQNVKEITVAIGPQGNVTVNKTVVPGRADIGPALETEARRLKVTLKDQVVIISADPKAKHGDVVRCIDDAKTVGVTKFAVATDERTAVGVTPTSAAPKR